MFTTSYTFTSGDGGVDDPEADGNGIACSGDTAANDPLCSEQYENSQIASLKVVPDEGYGFNGWIVDGAHIELTSADPLFLTTRPVLTGDVMDVQIQNNSTDTQADCGRQTVYLTFDDGPFPGTDDIIRILGNEGVEGSFFMTGTHIISSQREDWLRDAYENFEVGNHSYSHPYSKDPSNTPNVHEYYKETDANAQKVLEDFQKNDQTFSDVLGLSSVKQFTISRLPTKNTWRIPGVIKTDNSNGEYPPGEKAANLLSGNDYLIYGWDPIALWEDIGGYPKQEPQEMLNLVKKLFDNGSSIKKNKVVVLMHDRMFRESNETDVKLLEFIRLLKTEGYDFDYISNY